MTGRRRAFSTAVTVRSYMPSSAVIWLAMITGMPYFRPIMPQTVLSWTGLATLNLPDTTTASTWGHISSMTLSASASSIRSASAPMES